MLYEALYLNESHGIWWYLQAFTTTSALELKNDRVHIVLNLENGGVLLDVKSVVSMDNLVENLLDLQFVAWNCLILPLFLNLGLLFLA